MPNPNGTSVSRARVDLLDVTFFKRYNCILAAGNASAQKLDPICVEHRLFIDF